MRYLLILPIIVYTIGDTFRLSLSLGTGLSVKNAILYFVVLMLAMRLVIRGGYRFELPVIQACFGILIAYALCSILIAGLIVRYDGYHILDSVIALKSELIDDAIILGVFLYGTRTLKDGVFLIKVIVAAVTVANITYIAAFHGYIGIQGIGPGDCERDCLGGRASGPLGHPNGTGALLAAMLPAYVAIARSSRGSSPALWIVGAMCSIAMLLMTASRGAFFAMLIGYCWAAYVFRRYLSLRQILLWTGALIAIGAVVLILAGPHVAALFRERFVTESGASDIGALSSGRTGFWARALGAMMSMPLTFITGFGWNVYETMGFVYAAHSQYLRVWFELGLVGLCAFVFLVLRTLSTVRSSVDWASPLSRRYLIAFVFGFGAFLIALFFGDLYQPWTYVWAYAGVSLRMALVAVEAKDSAPTGAAGGGKRHVGLRDRSVAAATSRFVKPVVGAP
jgi:hypothetical protein